MRNSSLWSSFRDNFPRILFRDLRFRIWGLEIKPLKAHNFVWQGFFLSFLSRNFDDQFSSNFHRPFILCICWDTPSGKTGLWQLPIVSNVFNIEAFANMFLFGIKQEIKSMIINLYLSISRWLSSQLAYLIQFVTLERFFRMLSSNSFLFLRRYSWSSSGSVIFCLGGCYIKIRR